MTDTNDIFGCTMCGKCCKGFGGTFVSEEEIKKIAAYVGSDPDTFIARYCQRSGRRMVLAQAEDGYCIFWDQQCTIHEVKPRMCKAWPFIKPVLVDAKNWRVMANSCPGMRQDLCDAEILQCVENEISKSH